VMLATPSNPTGTLIGRDQLQEICELVNRKDGSLIVDEIYQGLVYETEPHTVLEIDENLFVINSFSKYYGMTGWRLGWMVAPESHLGALDRLAQNIFLSAPSMAQHAALAAFEPQTREILEQRRHAFQERRNFLLPALQTLGFDIPVVPEGAFYLYANCSSLTSDSFAFAMELLEKEGVAVTPGRDFGDNRPEEHLRFAYTTSIPKLQEGIERIRRFISA
jgi:aspartate/methionine/tyrosine aminotransferase